MMLFHHKNRKLKLTEIPHIQINGQKIELVNDFKFLGIKIDSHLTWAPLTNLIANKLSRVNGILHKLKHFLPPTILLIIYNALFHSHLTYGITSWGHTTTNNSRIGKIPKKAIRAINNSKYNSHTTPIFKTLGFLNLEDNFKLSCFKFYHKYKQLHIPKYFINMFTPAQTINRDATLPSRPRRTIKPPSRYADTIHDLPYTQNDIKIETTNKKYTRTCIRHLIPKLKNEEYLPEIILTKLDTHSPKGFTTYVKKHILSTYDPICHIINCYTCNQ